MNARAAAARAIAAVCRDGESLRTALPPQLATQQGPDASLVQSLVYGTLRWWIPLRRMVGEKLKKPLREKDLDVEALICVGIYQLLGMRTQAYAAVNEAAAAASDLGKPWAVGLVNGVLRNVSRENHQDWPPSPESAHPGWLRRKLVADWGDSAPELFAANQTPPPFWLRVNRRRIEAESYAQMLQDSNIEIAWRDGCAVLLVSPMPVTDLPGFADGLVSVQDRAAQLAADVVAAQAGDRVLDACAAPGGKSALLLEAQPELDELVAVDVDGERAERIRETFARLGVEGSVSVADASNLDRWWDGRQFDRILVDAPCSGTGVIRRHPDIRILRKRGDVAKLATQQSRLLSELWPALKPGGKLIYATCSVLTDENDSVVNRALDRINGARVSPIEAAWGEPTEVGRRIRSGERGMDGFYYACLEKS